MTARTILKVNGATHEVDADPAMPLLYVLRNLLHLKATRFGCGSGACGACTVVIEDRAQTSCNLPVEAVAGRAVTTLEGLAPAGQLHPIQSAMLACQAAQCGYCVSGVVMAAASLLDKHPSVLTRGEIAAALAGNLCRCGAQARMLDAIEAAAAAREAA